MWKKIGINGRQFYIKLEIAADYVSASISDLINVWEEVIPTLDAIDRFKQLNPIVKAVDKSVLEFISSIGEEEDCDLFLEDAHGERLIKMSKTLIPKMKYEFKMIMKPPEKVFREITLLLMMFVAEMKHRQDLLCEQLEAKDEEIMEYQLEGFKITRKNVITSKFAKEEFLSQCKDNIEERLRSNIIKASDVFIDDLNEFYPFYKKIILPTSTELLVKGQLMKEEKEEPQNTVLKEVAKPSKRKFAEPVVPVKRIRGIKRSII